MTPLWTEVTKAWRQLDALGGGQPFKLRLSAAPSRRLTPLYQPVEPTNLVGTDLTAAYLCA